MLVNQVLSSAGSSRIFTAIFEYFREFAPADWRVEVSAEPLPNADLFHYHRPQLERRLRAPAIATVHHDPRDIDHTKVLARFLPRYREAERIVCLNSGQAALLASKGIASTVTIPHGYNDRVLRVREAAVRAGPPVRLGLLAKRYRNRFKGEAYLFDLAKRLAPASFEFLLVGEGRSVTAQALAALGFHTRCYEYLPYRLFDALYAAMDYLLICSTFEGGPANLPEAIATGTPVLATAVGMVPDFIRDGVNGMILSGDVALDAERIEALADPARSLPSQLRHGARSAAASVPSWREVVDRHFALYRDVLQEARADG